jgi:hypothetical protein
MRNKICALAEDSHSVPYIMARFKQSRKAIRYTIAHETSRPKTNESKPRPGAKKTYSHLDERNILPCAREWPQDIYAILIAATKVKCSHKVIRHILQGHGINNWLSAKRPILTKKAVKACYEWCKLRRGWIVEEWGLIIWSDERSLERGSGKQRTWCFRIPDSKWDPKNIQTYTCGKDIRVMVWGCFWDNRRTKYYLIDRF